MSTTPDVPPPPATELVSHAQNWEDVVLWRGLGQVENGTYIDVGAADPVHFSVTKAFYDRGWSGVNVEPVAAFCDLLIAGRPRDVSMQIGAGRTRSTITLHRVVDTGLSTMVDAVADEVDRSLWTVVEEDVEVWSLDEIIEQSGIAGEPIHFLKIDVEGFEGEVLAGIDLRAHRPWVIVVEATRPNSTAAVHDGWEDQILDAGYEFTLFDGLNRFYVASERPDLVRTLSYPVCVFDRPFSTAHEVSMRAEIDACLTELDRKQTMIESALVELQSKQATLEALVADVDARDVALAATRAELTAKQQMLEASVKSLEDCRNQVRAVLESTSWRCTAPLRAVADRFSRRRSSPR